MAKECGTSLGTFESVGSTDLEKAGKAGLVTVQGKISAVLGTILVCKFLFPSQFLESVNGSGHLLGFMN